MSIQKGRSGAVKKNSIAIAQVQNWKIDSSVDIKDTTCLGDVSKGKMADLLDWKGTMDLLFDPSITEQGALQTAHLAGQVLSDVEFFLNASNKYSGSLIITTMSVSVPVGDLVKASVSFEGDGVLTYN
jgi:hypothetical protein